MTRPALFLDPDLPLDVAGTGPADVPRWTEPAHLSLRRMALIVAAGETLRLPEVAIGHDYVLFLSVGRGLREISPDGLNARLSIGHIELDFLITNDSPEWDEIELDLSALRGQTVSCTITCGPGPQAISDADWLAVFEFLLARRDQLPALRGRSFKAWRVANEVAHFVPVYEASFYETDAGPSPHESVEPIMRRRPRKASSETAPVVPPRSAFAYAEALLEQRLGLEPPDFRRRIRSLAQERQLRVLSLCSGAGRIEAELARWAGAPISFTLMDFSSELLEAARGKFPSFAKVETQVADLNDLTPSGEFDLIICVSGLHHLLELERISGSIAAMLSDTGEFWSIGEQIGRNGSRLWPDAYECANRFFEALPDAKRLNSATGRIDETLPNDDCSLNMFEGIRSEEIEDILGRFLMPVEVYKRNCFLWRMFNLSYVANYNCESEPDRLLVEQAVAAEYDHWRRGGRPTELTAVFEKKR
jgi:SAM-dependent methyltransferase